MQARIDLGLGFHGRVSGLFLYPDVPAAPPEVSWTIRKRIVRTLTDDNAIQLWRHDCFSNLTHSLTRNDPIDRLLMGFGFVADNISDNLGDLPNDNPDPRISTWSPINPIYPTIVQFGWHNPWVFDDLAKTLSTVDTELPGHEGELSLLIFHSLSDEFRGAFMQCRKLTRSAVRNYLLDRSGRQEWLELKLGTARSRKTITPLMLSSDLRSAEATSLHLIAIDDETRELIAMGHYEGISESSLESIGDHIASAPLTEVIAQIFESSPDPLHTAFQSNSSIELLRRLRQRLSSSAKCDIYLENLYLQGSDIDSNKILEYQGSLDGLKALIDSYAVEHPGEPIADIAFTAFTRQMQKIPLASGQPQLPTVAPEIYQGLRGPEPPPAFVQRVYGPWLGHGLTKAHIRKLDPKLYTAIDNWLKKPGCEWPADVDLPTLKEQNSRWADRVQSEGLANVLGDASPSFALKEAARLSGVLQRRREKR